MKTIMTSDNKSIQKDKRIFEIDLIRGICMILVIFDHFIYDITYTMGDVFLGYPGTNKIFNVIVKFGRWYWTSNIRFHVRNVTIFLFLCLIGICCSFTRNNIKRGAKLFLGAAIISIATFILGLITNDLELTITFGILHCAALSLFVIGLLEKVTQNKWVYWIISIVMIITGLYFYKDAGFATYQGSTIWEVFYSLLLGTNNYGSDCMPFLLYGGQIFAGVFIGKVLYANKKSLIKKEYKNNAITFVGRHSLMTYLIHQVVVIVALVIILLICGYRVG